jgi:hypothetical protein
VIHHNVEVMQPTPRTVVDAVRDFLESSGYPLEMQVARTFQREGFVVEQGRQYVDVKTSELRDMDVLATHRGPTHFFPDPGWRELKLIIECKRSKTPWVLFVGDERFSRSQPHFDSLDIIELAGAKLSDARSADDMPVISYVGNVAYRVSNAGAKDTTTFDTIRQVNSAVVGLRNDFVTPEQYDGSAAVVVLVPVVVTDAPLVECRLTATGGLDLQVAEMGLLYTRLRAEERLQSVWIVNSAALPAFAESARRSAENMRLSAPE